MIAETGHDELSHKLRLVYYKDKDWNDEGPNKMKVIAEHGKTPAVLTSAFRTDRATRDGKLIYMDKSYYEGKMK